MAVSTSTLYSPLVLFGFSTLIWWLVLTPAAVYYLLRYCQHRDNVSIRHRHWAIVLLLGCLSIFFWSIERPIEFVWSLPSINLSPNILSILQTAHHIVFPITMHGIMLCIVWRYYMLYYCNSFMEENMNMKWKIIINNSNYNMHCKHLNWFLVHQNQYGALDWLAPRIALLFLLIICPLIFSRFYDEFIAHILDASVSFFAILILFILWFRTPLIEDHFHIKVELKYILCLCIVEWLFYFGGLLMNMFFLHDVFDKYLDGMLFLLIQSWTAVLFAFCVLVICTQWTLYDSNVNAVNKTHKPASSTPTTRTPDTPSLSKIASYHAANTLQSSSAVLSKKIILSPRGKSLRLYECLQCKESFNSFMNHLMRYVVLYFVFL